MAALLQPPPLLTMGVVLLIAAAAMWLGLRSRPVRSAAASPEPAGRPAAGAATEEDEDWGIPDPAPPEHRPFSYDRLVAAAPDVESVEPRPMQPLPIEPRSEASVGPGAPAKPAGLP